MARLIWHSCDALGAERIWDPDRYLDSGTHQDGPRGHRVLYWGLSGAPTQWNGITILPGFGANYCSTSLSQHCKAVQPDLVITLGDVWVLDANLLREMPVAHWLPS